MEDSSEPGWRTSSYTGNDGGNCVEVADTTGLVLLRDTKDREGGTLAFASGAWASFTASLQ